MLYNVDVEYKCYILNSIDVYSSQQWAYLKNFHQATF